MQAIQKFNIGFDQTNLPATSFARSNDSRSAGIERGDNPGQLPARVHHELDWGCLTEDVRLRIKEEFQALVRGDGNPDIQHFAHLLSTSRGRKTLFLLLQVTCKYSMTTVVMQMRVPMCK